MLPIIPAALATLDPDATAPAFVSFFAGARFFGEPQEGGGVFAIGRADQANRLLFGEGGNDVASGEAGVDVIQANDGDDNIQGAGGPDFMFGGAGDDIVRGDAGDDVLVGQEGSDLAIGGEGADIFEFFADQFAEGETDVILDFAPEEDAIVVVGSADVAYDAVTGLVSVDGVDVVEVAPDLGIEVVRREGSAYVVGAATDLSGFGVAADAEEEAPDDALVGVPATDLSSAEATLLPGSTASAFVSFFAGARFFDDVQAGGGVFVQGKDGQTNVLLLGGSTEGFAANDVVTGGDGTDVIQSGDGEDNLQGGAGDDFVFGGLGDDIVRGDAGDDVLVGQEGSDVAIGGEGSDTFEFFADQFAAGELDTILDFDEDADQIVVVGSTDVAYDAVTGLVSVDGVALVEVAPDLDVEVVVRGETAAIVGAATLPGELADPMATAADAALATDGALLV